VRLTPIRVRLAPRGSVLALTAPVAALAQDNPLRRRARLRGARGAAELRRPPGRDLRDAPSGGAALQHLIRVDPNDGPARSSSATFAQSWTASPDRRTQTFKIRPGVKFHDGSLLTSKDVKASYDHIIFPPPGVVSTGRSSTARSRRWRRRPPTRWSFASSGMKAPSWRAWPHPGNWIYKADLLAADPRWSKRT